MKRIGFFLLLTTALFAEASDPSFPADIEGAKVFNQSIAALRQELRSCFEKASQLAKEEGAEEEYRNLLSSVRSTREQIRSLEEKWRQSSVEENSRNEEPYALWDVGETTLSQLIMEYGATDFLYVIPQELSGMRISLFSSVPLPSESWSEMIEMILAQNGIGAKRLNPFVKQLYILKLDPTAIEGIVGREDDLSLFSGHSRLFYVFSPPAEQLKSVQAFFERFSDPKQTLVQAIGSKLVLISGRETIEKLLGLYHAVWEQNQGKVVHLVNLTKLQPLEAEKILKAVFADPSSKGRPAYYPSNVDEIATLILPQGLVLIGEAGTVERGEKILTDMESQLEDPSEKVVYWYTCKHSKPEDIAEVLDKVYDSLIGTAFEKRAEPPPAIPAAPQPPPQANASEQQVANPFPFINPGAPFNPVMPATAPFVQPGLIDKNQRSTFGSFIVDLKTSAILMVVRREELPKIKALLRRLDVPKRMVQLDVLLVEKKLNDRKEIGFNLLQFGTNSSGKKETAFTYNGIGKEGESRLEEFKDGLLSFIFSRPKGKFPAADMKFNFLLTQQDIRINANPSVLAVNQTPATISIQEEISINNGAFPINTPTGTVIEKSFTRAQYGITINLTPTIHSSDEEDKQGFVSLETNLEFDTSRMLTTSKDDRPPVTRRHIENEVRVADGETIILGGLRQRIQEDTREKMPFLGDLPGVGKLFGTARASDINTEMFIFITPHIIKDPVDDLRRIRQEEYQKRAGDIPEFLRRLDDAKELEKKKIFSDSLKTLFDMYDR
jgi:general secretion pathway protein D